MRPSHIAWNLGGLVSPLLVAIFTIPTLITHIGQERFGILTLAWGLIGYAGVFDLGIGRALTQNVGKLLGERKHDAIAPALATASRITLIAGLIGGIGIVLATCFGAATLVKTVNVAQSEIETCLFLLAIVLPAQAMSITYKGLNEAYLNFKAISILRAVLGILNFGGPCLISFYSKELPLAIASLVVTRLVALFIYRKLAFACLVNNGLRNYKYSRNIAKSLFSFGGWLTVSSVLSPILTQADRFAIASIISATAVYVYVLPYELVVQSLIFVSAISSVIFPVLSRMIHNGAKDWVKYFYKWLVTVIIFMAFVCALIALFLPLILKIWIDKDFDQNSVRVGQILCIGVFANSVGSMFYALLHAKGKANITAKIHLVELPIFIFTLVFLIQNFGVVGAAWAWVARMICDCFALFYASNKLMQN